MSDVVSREDFDALRAEFDSFLTAYESETPHGVARRQERERAARRELAAKISAINDVTEFVTAMSALTPQERATVVQPDRAIELARKCTGATRQKLLDVLPYACLLEVAWTFYVPDERVKLTIAPSRTERLLSVSSVRVSAEDAERAERAGLYVDHEIVDDVGPVHRLEGLDYTGTAGDVRIMRPEAVSLWRALSPGIERAFQSGAVRAEPCTVEELRSMARYAAGSKREALPPIPLSD